MRLRPRRRGGGEHRHRTSGTFTTRDAQQQKGTRQSASRKTVAAMTHYFLSSARLASQSRDWFSPLRSNSTLPLMASPETLPWYLVVMVLPLISRDTVNDTSSPFIFPSLISVSW